MVRGDGTAPARRSVAPAAERKQCRAGARGRETRHPGRRDPAQCEDVLESRLLRHGLPDQRQAVDAANDDSCRHEPWRNADLVAARREIRILRQQSHRARWACAEGRRTAPERHQGQVARPPLRLGRRCDQLACPAAAQQGGRPAWRPWQAHISPPDPCLSGAFQHPDPRLCRRAAVGLLRSFSQAGCGRRSAGLQTRSPAAASGPLRDDPAGLGRRPCQADARVCQQPGSPRTGPRRLPSGKPGRPGKAPRRRVAAARLPARRDVLGSSPPRTAGDGRNPVCCRRQMGDAGS